MLNSIEINVGDFKVVFVLLHEGFITFQVIETDLRFKSSNYNLVSFQSAQGTSISSKNSPCMISCSNYYLQGAYEAFDFLPTIFDLKKELNKGMLSDSDRDTRIEELFDHIVFKFETALIELNNSLNKR